MPTPGEFDHQFLPRGRELEKKICPGGRDSLAQKIFSGVARGGCTQLELTETLGPVHMIPGQLTDPGVNFASVHGLAPVTVHMSLSLPQGNFERQVTRCTTPGNTPCRGNFSPCEQNAKVAPGQE